MTRLPSGENRCDRCGFDVENAGIDKCIIVSDLEPSDAGMVRNLHFCRQNGCDKRVLSKRNLKYLLEVDGGESDS